MTSTVNQATRRWLFLAALVVATGCGFDRGDTVSTVTIDVRCGSAADCPSGFECKTDDEHGPPTTLCESTDPAATCPAGYDTKVSYGQTVCKLPAVPIAGHEPRAGRVSIGGHRRSGL